MARCNKRLASCQAAFLFSRKSIKPMSPPPKIGRRCFEQGSILDPNNLVDWRGQSIWILYWSRQKGSQFEKEKRNVLMNASNWWHWGCGGAIETALDNFNQRSWQQELTRTFYYWMYSSAIDISLRSVFSKSLDNLNYWKLFKDPVEPSKINSFLFSAINVSSAPLDSDWRLQQMDTLQKIRSCVRGISPAQGSSPQGATRFRRARGSSHQELSPLPQVSWWPTEARERCEFWTGVLKVSALLAENHAQNVLNGTTALSSSCSS